MNRLTSFGMVILVLALRAAPAQAAGPRIVSSGPNGVEIEVDAADYRLSPVVLDGATFSRMDLPGAVWSGEPGSPAVPTFGVLLGIPYGAGVSVQVVEAEFEEVPGVDLMPVPEPYVAGRGARATERERFVQDPKFYSQDRFSPGVQAAVTRTGQMRDQRVAAVSIRPVEYNPVRKVLRIARRMRVRVVFSPGGSALPSTQAPSGVQDRAFDPVYGKALLNAAQAQGWRARTAGSPVLRKAEPYWYDPTAVYYKLRIREDGMYRLDADWFAASGISLGPGDLERLKLFVDGNEVPLDVRDGGDGHLDPGDAVLFYGRYRRAPDRDFENEHGRENVYWLTTSGGPGLRFKTVDAAPKSGFPEAAWFSTTVHAEADLLYETLGLAPDINRDHWYWAQTGSPIAGVPEYPVTEPVALPGLDRAAGGTAQIRVGMHGLTALSDFQPDHHTVVRLPDSLVVADDRWDGQTAFVASGPAPVSALEDTTQVTLATPGAPDFPSDYVDNVLLDWIEVTYPRRYEAIGGSLLFSPGTDAGRTLTIGGFRAPSVSVYDLDAGEVLTGLADTPAGTGFQAQFEVPGNGAGQQTFLAVDSTAFLRPAVATRDTASNLRGEQAGADYVIVTNSLFRDAAETLAQHRQEQGLSTQVVDVSDVYDEFSYGQLDPEAIRAFMTYAYANWTRRPSYLLLMGRASFDDRDLFGQAQYGRRDYVPALPFQSVSRGLAYTDSPYGTVAGNDPFPDVFVGRLSVNSPQQAATVVQKVIQYDQTPAARWRDQVLYMANYEDPPIFSAPSDSLAAHYTEPLGLETFKVYNQKDTPPEPNDDTNEVIRQINEGRLLVNFDGHGSAAIMGYYLRGSSQQQNYNYMSQIVNGGRLPLIIAMSCLNGLYADPRLVCLAEEMVNKPDGGAVAYVSASSLALVFSNDYIDSTMFRAMFQDSIRQFGQSLAIAKTKLLAAFPQLEEAADGMNLIGDPAQALAVPTGPDFAMTDGGITVEHEGELTSGDSVRVQVRVENWGIVPPTGPEVVLLDRNLDQGTVDTLFEGVLPKFGQADSLTVLWRLAKRVGHNRLEAVVDPKNLIPESDETNNRLDLDVEVFGTLTAVPTMPVGSQVVSASGAQLAVRSGVASSGALSGEFELNQTGDFSGSATGTVSSGPVGAESGLVLWRPPGLASGTYFWRARLSDGQNYGAWSTPLTFVVAPSAPGSTLRWQQDGATAFRTGVPQDAALFSDGSVGRVRQPPPIQFNAATRETGFAAEGVSGSAVLCTDGTYLYVKRFYTDPPIYPGKDTFERIGTGFGGTVAGRDYGPLSNTPVDGISATYAGDGYIYADEGKAHELAQISPETGAMSQVQVPDGLLEVHTGLVFDGHSLITSDGTYIYNVSSGVNGTPRAGWSVRVFDPADGWRLVRSFQVAPTNTGFGYLYTDGIVADGRYLYLIEFGTGLTHRVRVVDAQDGHFVEEFESDQANTDILSGQYDWINNRVWLGQLNGGSVYRYAGRALPDSGSVTSAPIGPASGWGSAQVTVQPASGGRAEVDVLGEGPTGTFAPLSGLTGLAPGTAMDLSAQDVSRIELRVHLFGQGLQPSPGLTGWSVEYQPFPDVALSDLKAAPTAVDELQPVTLTATVQNRGPLNVALGAVVAFYSGSPGTGRLIGRTAVPEETPVGHPATVSLVWNTAKFSGTNLLSARVEDLRGRPGPYGRQVSSAEPVVVRPSGDHGAPAVELVALDAAGEVRPEDYLPSEPKFRVTFTDTSGIDPASVQIHLTGAATGEVTDGLSSPQVLNRTDTATSLSFVYAPKLEDDRYVLEVSAQDQLGNGPAQKSLAFRVSSTLQIQKVLNVPNPMSDETEFTYILSRPASVKIRVYTISGRLIRILEDPSGRAGYNQIHWDGRDADGYLLANGVYLYTVSADDGSAKARVKERLIVYR